MKEKLTSFLHILFSESSRSHSGAVMREKGVKFVCFLVLVAMGTMFLPSEIISSPAGGKVAQEIKKSDEILVKFKNKEETTLVKISLSDDFDSALSYYRGLPGVEYAEPNYIYHASIIPTDTYYSNQWYLERIKAPEAWNTVRESADIVIAILDSGVQINHTDLKDNIWRNEGEVPDNNIDDDNNGFIDDVNGWDFVNDTADPNPKFNEGFSEAGILHGTIVAGIAAASGNNATGIAGISWRARIMPIKILGDNGEGNTNNVVKGIDYAIANGADVINLSFIGFGFSAGLDRAIKRAYESGIVVVAAAGNEQGEGDGYFLDDTPMYPVCHDGAPGENRVIGVAATDSIDQKASFSSFGFKCVDIAAPGLSIYGTVVYAPTYKIDEKYFNKYYDGYWSGTSMAAPMVSAAVALIEGANPGLNRNQVVEVLLEGADNINRLNPDHLNQLGQGRLNLFASVSQAKNMLENTSVQLLISPFSGYESLAKITSQKGAEQQEFLTYNSNFRGGVNIAAGDIDGDGVDEIITGAGPGGGPHVRIFDSSGNVRGQFFAYNSNFRGGVNVAAGDIDGDGVDEIITGAGPGGGPQVRVFDSRGNVQGQFFAYDSSLRSGVNVATGDIDGGARNNKAEIITGAGPGGGPHVRIFDSAGNVRGQFFAYNSNFRGGVNVAAGDIDGDGVDEIITGAGPGGAPHVRTFEPDGLLLGSFYAYKEDFSGGVNVAAIIIR